REQIAYERSVSTMTLSPRNSGELSGYQFNVTRRVRQTLGYLQATVTALAEVPGKKSIIFVTQSLPTEPRYQTFDVGPWSSLQSYLNDIARTASTNGIAIYCLQPDLSLGNAIGDIAGGPRGSRGSMPSRSSHAF